MPLPSTPVVTWIPTASTFPYVLTELQCVGEGVMFVEAISTPSYPIKYSIVSGEWPPSLTLNEDTGAITGVIDMNEISAPSKVDVPPEGFRFDETNYLKHHVSGVTLEFVVRATVQSVPPVISDLNATMNVRTNWSSRRDKLILNINNQFYLDGEPVSSETYLKSQKEKGYFPGPECNTEN
jgi:hypothetical protein